MNWDLQIDETREWLKLLGRDPGDLRIRAFGPDFAVKGNLQADWQRIAEWQASKRAGAYAVVNPGGDADADITSGIALFAEWDDLTFEEQVERPAQLGLPRPTSRVFTGMRSIHNYWRLDQPITPSHWRVLTQRLIRFCESDRSISNPSRTMRLPGAWYLKKGELGKRTSLLETHGQVYSVETFELLLPPLPSPPQRKPVQWRGPVTRDIRDIQDALDAIPRRVAGTGTYLTYLVIFWGLIDAVVQAGWGKAEAIALMEDHSPSAECGWNIEQIARKPGERVTAGSFWHHAKAHGWRGRNA